MYICEHRIYRSEKSLNFGVCRCVSWGCDTPLFISSPGGGVSLKRREPSYDSPGRPGVWGLVHLSVCLRSPFYLGFPTSRPPLIPFSLLLISVTTPPSHSHALDVGAKRCGRSWETSSSGRDFRLIKIKVYRGSPSKWSHNSREPHQYWGDLNVWMDYLF